MAQPPAYNRQVDFTDRDSDQTDHPALNAELDDAAQAINRLRDSLAAIQRDDQSLRLPAAALRPEELNALAGQALAAAGRAESAQTAATADRARVVQAFTGGQDRGDWTAATAYQAGQIVWVGNVGYQAKQDHTSGNTFAADLAAGKWVVFQGVTRGELSAAEGAGIVGFQQRGAGAVPRTMLGKARERVSLLDFIPESEHAAIRAGTSTYDCWPAMMSAIESYGLNDYGNLVGPEITVQPGVYKFSRSLSLKRCVYIHGPNGGLTGGRQVRFIFPVGSDGIVVNATTTDGASGTVAPTTSGQNSTIEGICVEPDGGLSLFAAPILDFNVANSQFIAALFGNPFAVGDAIRVPNSYFSNLGTATVTAVDTTATVLEIAKPGAYQLGETITGQTSGATGVLIYIGAQKMALGLKTVTGTFAANEFATGSVSGETALIVVGGVWQRALKVYTLTSITGTFPLFKTAIKVSAKGSGFTLRTRATIKNCKALYWPEFGCAITGGNAPGTNSNLSIVDGFEVYGVGLHGVLTLNGDSNACKITAVNAVGCGGYGISDESFLGNHYFSCHASDCGVGAYYSAYQNNFSVFLGCYSEGMGPYQPFRVSRSYIGRESVVIGGDHGAGFFTGDDGLHDMGFANYSGRAFRVGKSGFTGGLGPDGSTIGTFAITGSGGNPSVTTLVNKGQRSAGYGAYTGVRLPIGNALTPSKENLSHCVDGGKFGITWEPYIGSGFNVFLNPKGFVQSDIVVTGGAPTRPAVFYPVIVGGTIISLQVIDAGAGYTSAPTITGSGLWAGFTGVCSIFNGAVVQPLVTNGLSGLDSASPVQALTVNTLQVYPGNDNLAALGAYNKRWSSIYAGTSTISTSDARSKQGIRTLDEKERTVALKCKSLLRAFRFTDAVSKKGDGARIHFGAIAQDVKAAFESEGLRAEDYALLCYDKWDAQEEVIGEDGAVIQAAVESGDLYGIRYEELLCFIISAI